MKKFFLLMALSVTSSMTMGEESKPKNFQSTGFMYGIGVSVNQEIYKGYSKSVIPLPIIGYKGDKLSVLGPFVSYEVADYQNFSLSANIAPRFQGFDDSDSDVFDGMKERKNSLDAGFGVDYQKSQWQFGLKAMFDVLNKSDGYELNASVAKRFKHGPVFFTPSLSVSYLDENHVDYYYGVRENEVSDLRSAYQGENAVNTTLGMALSTPIFFEGMTRFSVNYTWYDSSITDSPLVDSDGSYSAQLIFSKFF